MLDIIKTENSLKSKDLVDAHWGLPLCFVSDDQTTIILGSFYSRVTENSLSIPIEHALTMRFSGKTVQFEYSNFMIVPTAQFSCFSDYEFDWTKLATLYEFTNNPQKFIQRIRKLGRGEINYLLPEVN